MASDSRADLSQAEGTQRRLRLDGGVGVLLSSDLMHLLPSTSELGRGVAFPYLHPRWAPVGLPRDGNSAHGWSSCLLPAQSSPNTWHLTPPAPKSWSTEHNRPSNELRMCLHPCCEDLTLTCLHCCPCCFPSTLSAGLEYPPIGSSPNSARLAPAGAPRPRGLLQQLFCHQEVSPICAPRCLESSKGTH